MDREALDQALRLGSLTPKNPISDLGKFGMGLVTAGLSLARQTTVITRQGETFLTSVVDVDQVIKRNSFCKYLGEATKEQRELFETVIPDGSSGTLVLFETCDGIRNRNTTVFANTLRKHLGRIHRYFLKAGKRIIVNDEEAIVIDPLELESEGTETFSDEEYPVTTKIDGRERHDMVRGCHAVSCVRWLRGWFERNITVAGGRPTRHPYGTFGPASTSAKETRT